MGFGINNPVPRSLGSESRKAAKILTSFVKPNQIISYAEVIPPHVLHNAKGLCIITVLRAGFLFSGRAGSGVIVARLPDGTWSPPSAVMTAGAGAGGMIGADLTDFIFVLNNAEAVKTFASAGTLTLGGNVSLAAGPLGRAGEASGAAGTQGVATVFSYAKTKGLYAGISLEGSILVERKEANQKFYGRPVPAKTILAGRIPAPRAVEPLFRVLDSRAFRNDVGYDDMDDDFYNDMPDVDDYDDMSSVRSGSTRYGRGAATGSGGRSGRYADDYDDYDEPDEPPSRRRGELARAPSSGRRSGARHADDYDYDDEDDYDRPRRSGARSGRDYTDDYDDYRGGGGASGSYRSRDADRYDRDGRDDRYSSRDRDDRYSSRDRDDRYARDDRYGSRSDRYDSRDRDYDRRDRDRAPADAPSPKPKPAAAGRGMQAVALYSFSGEEDGDLTFRKGDVITITAKSDSTDDWWTGEFAGKKGIFPANYVELV